MAGVLLYYLKRKKLVRMDSYIVENAEIRYGISTAGVLFKDQRYDWDFNLFRMLK